MRQAFSVTLVLIAALAVTLAPAWAGSRVLADAQLDHIYAGSGDAQFAEDGFAQSTSSGTPANFVGAAVATGSSATAVAASNNDYETAVQINNQCQHCVIETPILLDGGAVYGTVNAQSELFTVGSVNAVQINAAGGNGDISQRNVAYSTGHGIGHIDSTEASTAIGSSAATATQNLNLGNASAAAATSVGAAASAASADSFVTPQVNVNNQCATMTGSTCALGVAPWVEGASVNAQSVLMTVGSVNAVQINAAAALGGSGGIMQSNIAFSGGGLK